MLSIFPCLKWVEEYTKGYQMIYGVIFWVTLFMFSWSEGMRTWTRFDEVCLRIYAKAISTAWYWEERLNDGR